VAVHVGIGEQPQFLELVGVEQMSFVDLSRTRDKSTYADPGVMPTGWWVVVGFLGVGGVSAGFAVAVLGIITGF
jgi:hypothetical protein